MKLNKKELLREFNLRDDYNMADLEILKIKICILEEMLLGSDEVEATTISAPIISEGDKVRVIDCGEIYPNFDEFVRYICKENYSEDTGEQKQIYEIWKRDMWEDCLEYLNKIGTVLNLGKHPYKNDVLVLIALKSSGGNDVIKLISTKGLELVN